MILCRYPKIILMKFFKSHYIYILNQKLHSFYILYFTWYHLYFWFCEKIMYLPWSFQENHLLPRVYLASEQSSPIYPLFFSTRTQRSPYLMLASVFWVEVTRLSQNESPAESSWANIELQVESMLSQTKLSLGLLSLWVEVTRLSDTRGQRMQ